MRHSVQMPLLVIGARPFLKWAGGKGQLLDQIDTFLPRDLKKGTVKRYCEPFVGGGAVFFHITRLYSIPELLISDINPELMLAYRAIQRDVNGIISLLRDLSERYLPLNDAAREAMFYEVRVRFNAHRPTMDFSKYSDNWVERTAQIIFLNRTCYNGLFRVNSRGDFNVPFGRYKNPAICDPENLMAVSQSLQSVHIHHGDFTELGGAVDGDTFVYFDPPYRPLSRTANFTSYSQYVFDDAEQLRLASFYRELDAKGARLMLSNSDPKNEDPQDDFFEKAYRGYRIERVKANRNINSDAEKRGPINELLIMNY